jgi:predicted ester cyclase
MSTEQNKRIARRLYDLLNAADVQAAGDLATVDYVEHDPLPGQGTGREGVVDRFSMIVSGLAPRFAVEDVIAEGDTVVVRWTNAGTHVGEFLGMPPTGRAFTIGGIDVYRVDGDLLCEHWHQLDQLSMLGQLGLLPQAASSSVD